jgi:DNA invertase Pin-like site-specific DNA recombinase
MNLKDIANEKGWVVKRVFEEVVSGITNANDRKQFQQLLKYVDEHSIKLIMVSEVSRCGRRVIDVLNVVEDLHKIGVGIYIQQFNMVSYEKGKENAMVKMLLQMLSIGAEMENNLRKIRQIEGIALAKLRNRYTGKMKGATMSKEKVLNKHSDVVMLIEKSDLSIRKIATISKKSINTVRKVKQLLETE